MAKLQTAIESVERLAQGYRAVIDLADALKEIGNLDAARKETERGLTRAREDLAKARSDMDATQEATRSASDQARSVVEASGAEAEEIRATARGDAGKIVDEARVEAREIVHKANAKIQARAEAAEKEIVGVLAKLERDQEAARGILSKIVLETTEAEVRRETVRAELEKVEIDVAKLKEGVGAL